MHISAAAASSGVYIECDNTYYVRVYLVHLSNGPLHRNASCSWFASPGFSFAFPDRRPSRSLSLATTMAIQQRYVTILSCFVAAAMLLPLLGITAVVLRFRARTKTREAPKLNIVIPATVRMLFAFLKSVILFVKHLIHSHRLLDSIDGHRYHEYLQYI